MRWGPAPVIVTHDIQESLQIVDYIYFISEGRVAAEGTPDEIRHHRPFVHQFVHAEADGPGALPLSGAATTPS